MGCGGIHSVEIQTEDLGLNGDCVILLGVEGMMEGVRGRVTVSDLDTEACPGFGQAEGKS